MRFREYLPYLILLTSPWPDALALPASGPAFSRAHPQERIGSEGTSATGKTRTSADSLCSEYIHTQLGLLVVGHCNVIETENQASTVACPSGDTNTPQECEGFEETIDIEKYKVQGTGRPWGTEKCVIFFRGGMIRIRDVKDLWRRHSQRLFSVHRVR